MKRLARFVELYPVLQQQRKPMANGLATLICVMTLERRRLGALAARGIYSATKSGTGEQQ